MRFSLRRMSADGRTRLCTCLESRRLGEHVHAGRAVPDFRTSSIKTILFENGLHSSEVIRGHQIQRTSSIKTILFENGLHCTLVKSAYLWGKERAP